MGEWSAVPPPKLMRIEEDSETGRNSEEGEDPKEELEDPLLAPRTSIRHLPPEIVVYIFSFLDLRTLFLSVSVVCQSWNDLVRGDAVWAHFRRLTLERRKIPLPLRTLIERCTNVSYLDIVAKDAWPKRHINATVFDAIACLRKLQTLSIRYFLIHSDCAMPLQRCLLALPLLQTLDLSYCKLADEVGSALAVALTRSGRLETLRLMGHSFSNRSLTRVIEQCRPLRTLDLSACNMTLDSSSLGAILGAHSSTLTNLNLLRNTVYERDFAPIEDCSRISRLKVDCSDLTDRTLLRLRGLPLKELELHGGFGFSSEGLVTFFEEGDVTSLETLHVHGSSMLTDDALKVIGARCPALRVLRAGSCPHLTDDGVRYVVRRCTMLTLVVFRGVTGLRGEFLKEMHHCLRSLKLLDLAYCDGLVGHLRTFLELGAPRFRVEVVPHWAVPYCGSTIDAHRYEVDLDTVTEDTFSPVVLISKSMSQKLVES